MSARLQTSALHDPVAAAVHAAAAQVADKIVGDAWAMALKLGRQRDRRVLQDMITSALEDAMAPRSKPTVACLQCGHPATDVTCSCRCHRPANLPAMSDPEKRLLKDPAILAILADARILQAIEDAHGSRTADMVAELLATEREP